jgi:hypothetical protein
MKKTKGVVLSSNSKSVILLTPSGEYVKVPANNRIFQPGTEIETELPSFNNIKKLALAASLFCIIALTFIFNVFTTRTEAYLALDINPSILLSLGHNAEVIKAEALNREGEEILRDLKLKNLNVIEAVKLILENVHLNNYLFTENNEIFISLAAPSNYVISEEEIKSYVSEQVWQLEIDSYLKISRTEVQQAMEAQEKHVSLNSMVVHRELTTKGIFKEVAEDPKDTPPASVKEITRAVGKEKVFKEDEFIPGNKGKEKRAERSRQPGTSGNERNQKGK